MPDPAQQSDSPPSAKSSSAPHFDSPQSPDSSHDHFDGVNEPHNDDDYLTGDESETHESADPPRNAFSDNAQTKGNTYMHHCDDPDAQNTGFSFFQSLPILCV